MNMGNTQGKDVQGRVTEALEAGWLREWSGRAMEENRGGGAAVYMAEGCWPMRSPGGTPERGSTGNSKGQMRWLGLVKADLRWRVVGVERCPGESKYNTTNMDGVKWPERPHQLWEWLFGTVWGDLRCFDELRYLGKCQ